LRTGSPICCGRACARAKAAGSNFSLGGLRRLIFPLGALALVLTGRWVLTHYQPNVSLLNHCRAAADGNGDHPLCGPLQRLVFAPAMCSNTFERTIVWLVWIGFALLRAGARTRHNRILRPPSALKPAAIASLCC